MIADLKPYPAMKDSGVPWLGEVPEHWDTRPLKRWVTMNAEVLPETTAPDHEFRYLDIGSVGTGILTQKPQRLRFEAAPSRARRVVHKGDTIVSTVRTYLKAIYFADGEADEFVCSTGFAVLTPRVGTLPKFVSYLAQSNPFTDRVTSDSVGIAYPAIAETRLGSFHVAVPPLPEQAAIVRFLDIADRRIRRYIRAKQKLIKLLEEQKQAIIHRAVTRGLDPNVCLKPSGVEWLGDVPEHWQVMRVKQCAYRISKGTTPSTEGREILEAGPVRFIKAENVSGGRILDRPGCFIDEQTNAALRRSQLREHDILFVIAGATLGKIAVVESAHLPANTNQAVAFIRPKTRVNHCFLSLWLQSSRIRELIWLNAVQSAQPNLSMADLGSFVVPVPPLMEQRQIVDAVGMKVVPVDNGIDRAHREISLLREYRIRLIADVVTGKLDVREAAERLVDETEQLEPLDEADALTDAEEDAADILDAAREEVEA